MTPVLLLISGFIAFAATVLLVRVVCSYAHRKGMVDHPDGDRKLHHCAVPNIGGLAIFGGFGVGLLALQVGLLYTGATLSLPHWAFFAGAFAILATGLCDDIKGLGFKSKFFIQLIIAYGLLFAGYRIDVSFLPFVGETAFDQALYSVPLTLMWIVGAMNAFNLIDGLDGLASGLAAIAAGFFIFIFAVSGSPIGLVAIAVLLIGVFLGFLAQNFPPAKIFLGDSGSLLAGYLLAVLALEGTSTMSPSMAFLVPVLVLGVPLVDTSVCMLRRILEGRSPFHPDHDHIHHRLSAITSERNATLILYAVATWFGLAAVLILRFPPGIGYIIGGVTIASAVLGVRSLGYVSIQEAMSLRKYVSPAFSERFLRASSGEFSGAVGDSGPSNAGPYDARVEADDLIVKSGDGQPLVHSSSAVHTIRVNPVADELRVSPRGASDKSVDD